MTARDIFRGDSLRALSATRARRWIGFLDVVVYGTIVFALLDILPPWVWIVIGASNLVVAFLIGSWLADRDARARVSTNVP